nr:MAG: RNA-dependent RNA polymerase [Permutotetraviridae sp.]
MMASNEQQQFGTLTAQELLALPTAPSAPRTPPRGGRERTASGQPMLESMGLTERLARIGFQPTPQVAPKINNDLVKKRFEKCREKGCLDFIAGLPRDPTDSRAVSAKSRSLGSYTTNEMTFTHFGKDGEIFNHLKQINPANYDETEMLEFAEALERSTQTIGSSGSLEGVVTRLSSGMIEAPKVTLNVARCVRWANRVLKFEPVINDFRGKSVVDMIDIVEPRLKFNLRSNAGVPYYKTISVPGVFKSGLDNATMVLNSIADGSFNALVRKRPSLLAVLLKNKQDFYEISKLRNKIRPYFVYPLHERLLYSLLQTGLKGELFTKDLYGPSGSAIGFSWNYGGGDRLYAWIVAQTEKGPGFYPAFYGDDQLWVVVLPGGGVYIFTPDFSHMDMSLSSSYGKIAYAMWKPAFGENLDNTWDAALRLNCTRAFNRTVVVDGALTFQFKHGLASGIPGTSKFDEVASAVVCGYLQERFALVQHTMSDIQDVVAWLVEEKSVVASDFGLIFKEGTLAPYPFVPDQDSYPFVFLGQKLVQVYGGKLKHYVPMPDLEKMLISASTLKKSYKTGDLKARTRMAAVRSLYAQGGYHYGPLSHALQAAFESHLRRGYRPITEEDDEYTAETENSVFIYDVKFNPGDHSWPSRDWCVNLYLPPDDQRDEQSGRSLEEQSEGGSEAGPIIEREDLLLEELEDFDFKFEEEIKQAVAPSNWADLMALERQEDDVGIADNPLNKAVAPEYMGKIVPLSAEVKAAYKKKLQEDAAERRAARERAYANRTNYMRGLKPSQMQGKAYNKLTRQQKMLEVLLNDHDDSYQEDEDDYFGDYHDVRDS